MNQSQQKGKNISVYLRIKPKMPDESNKKYTSMEISNSNTISIPSKKKEFTYDYIEDENSTQKDIFEHCGKKICDYALEGYNTTIFAYGQTGSGKTYTLLGEYITNKANNKNGNISDISGMFNLDDEINNNNSYDINDEGIGLVPRILYYLFQNSPNEENRNKFTYKISYMEIYNERLLDLLNPNNKEKVKPSDINGKVDLKNLSKLIVNTPEEAIKFIIDGNLSRHYGSTLMNNESSRSHAIISIYIENNIIQENKIKKSVFHIIDLAGSERQKNSGAEGTRVREAGNINNSLMNLSKVIREIINNDKQISYRDSKLTHVLRDSLGGNAKISIIATISQLEHNLEETICTLNFAQEAKKIKNNAIINVELINNNDKIKKDKFLDLQNKYNSKCQQYDKLIENLEKQNEDINKMKKDVSDKEVELKGVKEENIELKNKINNMKNEIKNLKDEKKLTEMELDKVSKELYKFNDLQNNYNEILKKYDELQKIYKNQENIINEKDENLDKQNENINKIVKDISNKEEELKKIKDEIKELNNEKKKVTQENNDLKNKINKLEEEINNQKLEINNKEENLKSEWNKKMKNMNTKIETLEKENEQLKEKYNTSQKSISKHLDTISSLNNHKISLENKISSLVKHFSNLLNNNIALNTNYSYYSTDYYKDFFNKNYEEIKKKCEKVSECLKYCMTKKSDSLDEDIKQSIDEYGINFCCDIYYDFLKDNLYPFRILVKKLFDTKNKVIENLQKQKEMLINDIKSHIL